MGWFDNLAAGAAQSGSGSGIGGMFRNVSQQWAQQQANPWGATPATPNAVQSGSLAALGLNTTQPVPGMPPRQFDPSGGYATTMPMQSPPPSMFFNPDGTPIFTGGAQTGLMGPPGSQGGPLPSDAGPMPQFGPYGGGYDQNTHQWVNNTQPVGFAPTGGSGSLQSLGGGMNQSGLVTLRGPDGSTKAVPQSDLAHWLSRGAQQVGA